MIDTLGMTAKVKSLPDLEYAVDRTVAYRNAAAEGLEIDVADGHILQIDCDNFPSRIQFTEMLPQLLKHYGVLRVTRAASRNGKSHYRVYLREPIPAYERVALQALLGSDPVREMMNLLRLRAEADDPILLFRVPDNPEETYYESEQ